MDSSHQDIQLELVDKVFMSDRQDIFHDALSVMKQEDSFLFRKYFHYWHIFIQEQKEKRASSDKSGSRSGSGNGGSTGTEGTEGTEGIDPFITNKPNLPKKSFNKKLSLISRDSDSNPSDSDSDEDSITDNTNSTPEQIVMEHFDVYGNEMDDTEPQILDTDTSLPDDKSNKQPGKNPVVYKKLTYHSVEKLINKYYLDPTHRYSSALDILASYLRGQKHLYMESKHYSDTYLNLLMMPAIFFSAMASVFGSVSKYYQLEWGTVALSFVNAGIAFLLAVINYFKLDAASEAHKISSHQYDRLQSSVEFTSGNVLLFHTIDSRRSLEILEKVCE